MPFSLSTKRTLWLKRKETKERERQNKTKQNKTKENKRKAKKKKKKKKKEKKEKKGKKRKKRKRVILHSGKSTRTKPIPFTSTFKYDYFLDHEHIAQALPF